MVSTRVQAVVLALTATAVGLTTTAAPAEATTSLRSLASAACPVAAHRGDHTRYTENGLNAFRSAIADRANILEMDVQTTRDGVLMLMHDETVTRTTNGRGSLGSLTYRQVRALRMNDGSRVPTLAAVLALAAPTRARVYVEIKHIPEDPVAEVLRPARRVRPRPGRRRRVPLRGRPRAPPVPCRLSRRPGRGHHRLPDVGSTASRGTAR